MTANELLATLRARGITLESREGVLRAAPREALTDELRQGIREHKAELLTLIESNRGGGSTPPRRPTPPMPAEIQAAYDRGEFVGQGKGAVYVEALGRWEVQVPTGEIEGLSPLARGVVGLYQSGEFPEPLRSHLAALFRERPPDLREQLEHAARLLTAAKDAA